MITAVDTNVLADVFKPDPTFGPLSKAALSRCRTEGRLIGCEAVWAELAAFFPSSTTLQEAMDRLTVDFSPVELKAALLAGSAWKIHRSRGGKRDRLVADFLIGAHAFAQAERLLTRDRGFYRTYFSRLRILDPTHV